MSERPMPADPREVLRGDRWDDLLDDATTIVKREMENADPDSRYERIAGTLCVLTGSRVLAALSSQPSGEGEREPRLGDGEIASALHLILLDDGGPETRLRWSDRDVLKAARDRLAAPGSPPASGERLPRGFWCDECQEFSVRERRYPCPICGHSPATTDTETPHE